ncbi:MAG: hypothetical protein AAB706_00355 [Patescibacteria group bacterium]
MKTLNYRHGDICFIEISKLPTGLKATKDDVILLSGSGGNPHTFKGGIFYPKINGEFIIGYFKAKDTRLYHLDHGEKKVGGLKEAKIGDGIYEIRRQVEVVNGQMRQVVD